MGTRNDDISLILAKAKKQGFLPDVSDSEVDILTSEAQNLFKNDLGFGTVFETKGLNTVIPFGTSITNQGFTTGTGNIGNRANGYLTWANIILGHRLKVIRNAGISGNTSDQMLARIDTDVIAYSPTWCIVESAIPNDIGNGFSVSKIIANHKSIYDKLSAAGIKVVVTTSLPYGISTALSTRQQMHAFSVWVKNYARDKGFIICDWGSAVVDGNSALGLWPTDFSDGVTSGTDGVHPTQPAALRMGKVLAEALDKHLPNLKGQWLPSSPADPYNLIGTMGFQQGTTGTRSAPGGSGNVATGWTIYGNVTHAYIASKVARTDGISGEWQAIEATTGNVDGLTYQCQNQNLGTDFNIGDRILCAIEFKTDPGSVTQQFSGSVTLYGGTFNPIDGVAGGAEKALGTNGTDIPTSGVFLVDFVIPTGTTRLQPTLSWKASTGKIYIGRVGLYNLTTLNALSSYSLSG